MKRQWQNAISRKRSKEDLEFRNQEGGKRTFLARMDEIDKELGAEDGPFFLGWGYSLVDIVFAPFLERIAASIPYYKVRF